MHIRFLGVLLRGLSDVSLLYLDNLLGLIVGFLLSYWGSPGSHLPGGTSGVSGRFGDILGGEALNVSLYSLLGSLFTPSLSFLEPSWQLRGPFRSHLRRSWGYLRPCGRFFRLYGTTLYPCGPS